MKLHARRAPPVKGFGGIASYSTGVSSPSTPRSGSSLRPPVGFHQGFGAATVDSSSGASGTSSSGVSAADAAPESSVAPAAGGPTSPAVSSATAVAASDSSVVPAGSLVPDRSAPSSGAAGSTTRSPPRPPGPASPTGSSATASTGSCSVSGAGADAASRGAPAGATAASTATSGLGTTGISLTDARRRRDPGTLCAAALRDFAAVLDGGLAATFDAWFAGVLLAADFFVPVVEAAFVAVFVRVVEAVFVAVFEAVRPATDPLRLAARRWAP